MILLLAACAEPVVRANLDPVDPPPVTPDPIATGTTADTGPEPIDCSRAIDPEDLTYRSLDVAIEEDFDFDEDGNLLTEGLNGLVGVSRDGDTRALAGSVGEIYGIRSTVEGDVALVDPTGVIRLVDPRTGGSDVVFSGGLTYPNGLEASEDGTLYVTDAWSGGWVHHVDPLAGSGAPIVDLVANGVVLSHDEQTLYLTVSTAGGGGADIVAVSRALDGTWDPASRRVLYVASELVTALTVDACENLYGVGYNSGRVFRIDATGQVTVFVALPAEEGEFGTAFTAIHFSPGFGDWDPTALYVSNRQTTLFEVPTGVPGSHVLMP